MRGSVCEIPEGFHPIPYAPCYFADELGRIGSSKRGTVFRIMVQKISRDGARVEVNLNIDQRKTMHSVARLTLNACLGVINGKYQMIYLNGNPFDCSLKNLQRIPIIPIEERMPNLVDWVSVPNFLRDD